MDQDAMTRTAPTATDSDVGGLAAGKLKSFVERIERLEEEKAGIAADIKDIYSEAKGEGFDTKIIRKIISLRKKDRQERQEEEELLELYKAALGME
ncbi:MAG: DUF2312 domain-containing protein [Rhodospirillales bacterium]|jgi:uncharacterized protein (UPF0335 family)